MGLPPSGVCDSVGRIAVGGEPRLPPPEHSHTVYCNQAHYGTVSGGRAEAGVKVGQAVVGSERPRYGGNSDGGLGGGIDVGL